MNLSGTEEKQQILKHPECALDEWTHSSELMDLQHVSPVHLSYMYILPQQKRLKAARGTSLVVSG